jgi:hypothetical protein
VGECNGDGHKGQAPAPAPAPAASATPVPSQSRSTNRSTNRSTTMAKSDRALGRRLLSESLVADLESHVGNFAESGGAFLTGVAANSEAA